MSMGFLHIKSNTFLSCVAKKLNKKHWKSDFFEMKNLTKSEFYFFFVLFPSLVAAAKSFCKTSTRIFVCNV